MERSRNRAKAEEEKYNAIVNLESPRGLSEMDKERRNKGWVKLYRDDLDNGMLRNHKLWIFWSYCNLKATYRSHKVYLHNSEVLLTPGQFVFGRKVAAAETGLSEQTIRTCMKNMIRMRKITSLSTTQYSIITVLNWETEQGTEEDSDLASPARQPIGNRQTATYKKYQNEKKEKNEIQKNSGGEGGIVDDGWIEDKYAGCTAIFKN